MALNRAALDKFYEDRKPYLDEIIGNDFEEHAAYYQQFCNVKSAKSGWIDTATVSSFGLFSTKAELDEAAEDDVLQGPVARAKVVTYAKRHMVSQEAIEDDEGDGIIAGRLPGILRTGRATKEVLAHDLLNGGHTLVKTPDNVALFSAVHKAINGDTYSNKPGTADLSEGAIQSAITTLDQMVDDRGIPIMKTPSKLIVSTTDRWVAQVLMDSAKVTTSNFNAINPIFSMNLGLCVSPYLTDQSWYLQATDHDLNWYDRIAMENWSEVNYQRGGVEIGARFRAVAAALDPRGIVGSLGA